MTSAEHAFKLVAWYADPEHPSLHASEVYDLTLDPCELENLIAFAPLRAAAL